MTEVSLLPILAAGVVSILIGGVWYHPKVFGATWMRMSGMTPEMAERGKKRMPLYVLVAFCACLIVACVMSYFAIAWGVHDWIGAIKLGFWLWVGFTAPPMLGMVLWEHKPIHAYIIVSLHWLVIFIAIATVLFLGQQPVELKDSYALPQKTIELRGQTIHVSVADTPETREVGLGGRVELASDEGMFFVFPEEGKYGFWMKNMSFSIDIVWIANDGGVVYLAQNISPDTYPKTFAPLTSARYVLELSAGFVSRHGVVIGDIVRL